MVRVLLVLVVLLGASAVVAAAGAVPPLSFVRHDIDSGVFAQVTEGLDVVDIDADGRPVIVEACDQFLVWYHNPDWRRQLIASGFKFGGGAMVVVRDLNGDGRLDVLTGKYAINAPNNR